MRPVPRPATVADIPAVRALERRAGEPFRTVGLDSIADDDPPSDEELAAAISRAGRGTGIFVVDDGNGEPAAWMWLTTADGDLHIAQVSVDPAYRGHRLGTGLINHALHLARDHGYPGVSLTSFVDVPWNGPLYRRLGFTAVDDSDAGPDLRRIRAGEQAAGLDVRPRAAYRRADCPVTPAGQ